MFYSFLLMMSVWSCMICTHELPLSAPITSSTLSAHALVDSALNRISGNVKKVSHSKVTPVEKSKAKSVAFKNKMRASLDDALMKLSHNGKQEQVHLDSALKRASNQPLVEDKSAENKVADNITQVPLQVAVDIVTQTAPVNHIEKKLEALPVTIDVAKQADVATTKVVLSDPIIEDVPSCPTRKVNLAGRCNSFYLQDEYAPKRFAIIGSVYNTFCLDQAYNNCKRAVPMSELIFGSSSFTIGDIFLLSRLSENGNLYSSGTSSRQNINQRAQTANPTIMQYLALVAPTKVILDADAYEMGADLSFVYRFNFGKCIDVACSVGLNVPVICQTHELDLRLINSRLVGQINYAAGDTTVRDGSLNLFFNEFVSIEDFFYRAVLLPKGLTLERKQQTIGFGDISLFSTFDFAPSLDWVDGLQVGFNLSFPTAKKPTGNSVWEIQLGAGAVQLDLFSNAIFNGGTNYFNPTVYLAGQFSFQFTSNMRIPQIVRHVSSPVPNQPADRVTTGTPPDVTPNIPGLVVPGAPPAPDVPNVFRNYYTTSFSEVDSTVRYFADSVSSVRSKIGSRVVVGFGNYFYATSSCQLRLGVFYDFTAKGADNLCVYNCSSDTTTVFDTSLFTCISEYGQRISWHAAYKLGCCGEFMIGTQHIVAGKNVYKTNQAFATFVGTF